jgi:hypothetical protein
VVLTIAAVAANHKCALIAENNIRQYGDQEKLKAGTEQKGEKYDRDGTIHANRVKNRMRAMDGETAQGGRALLHFELQLSSCIGCHSGVPSVRSDPMNTPVMNSEMTETTAVNPGGSMRTRI